MEGSERISELLVKTGAYTDLDEPVILTSGELGIYYINTEKLLEDNGEWKQFWDDSNAMVQHAIAMELKNPNFKEVIDIVAQQVDNMLPEKGTYAISGGQRRDWLFSGPVAARLKLGHVSLYKDGKIEVIRPADLEYKPTTEITDFSGTTVLHISDLLTKASSAYRTEGGTEKGWIPMLRHNNAEVKDLIAIVTRVQGGEERLREQNVNVHSFVSIDEGFLKKHSTKSERAVEYINNPEAWTEAYLKENGAMALLETFNPRGGKLERAKAFLDRYGNCLAEKNKYEELDKAAEDIYGFNLAQLVGDTIL